MVVRDEGVTPEGEGGGGPGDPGGGNIEGKGGLDDERGDDLIDLELVIDDEGEALPDDDEPGDDKGDLEGDVLTSLDDDEDDTERPASVCAMSATRGDIRTLAKAITIASMEGTDVKGLDHEGGWPALLNGQSSQGEILWRSHLGWKEDRVAYSRPKSLFFPRCLFHTDIATSYVFPTLPVETSFFSFPL